MFFAGVDVGSLSADTVIMDNGEIVAYSVLPTGGDSTQAAYKAMEVALNQAALKLEDIVYTVATGYGRVNVPFAKENITEISCHARGAHWLIPSTRTILDMGGQDCKAIRCDGKGHVVDFAMNEKCAAGTGRYLEIIAEVLEMRLEEIGPRSLEAKEEVGISSACAVFARSEVLSLVRKGVPKDDVLGGVHQAIVHRVHALIMRVGIEKDFMITGGIAKNIGVVRRLEKRMGLDAKIPGEPQIVGALGAALFAEERFHSGIQNGKGGI
jgi:predicted CoA-substrate-specific enzyme activase